MIDSVIRLRAVVANGMSRVVGIIMTIHASAAIEFFVC